MTILGDSPFDLSFHNLDRVLRKEKTCALADDGLELVVDFVESEEGCAGAEREENVDTGDPDDDDDEINGGRWSEERGGTEVGDGNALVELERGATVVDADGNRLIGALAGRGTCRVTDDLEEVWRPAGETVVIEEEDLGPFEDMEGRGGRVTDEEVRRELAVEDLVLEPV